VYGAVNIMCDELPSYDFIWPPRLARVLARVLDCIVPRLADFVVCYTPTIHDCLKRIGVPPERLAVIKLGIDLSMFARAERGDARERMGLNGEPLVVYTGVLNRFQRIDYLIRAMRVVVGRLPNAKLAFVRTLDDEGPRREVEQLARSAGVAHAVVFPEIIRLNELPAYIAAADASAVPRPDCPGVPVKLLNFMAVGKPVVITRGSSQGLHHEDSALITEDHDPDAMGRALLRILEDKALATRLGRRARELAYAEYDRLATARELVGLYRRVLAGRRNPEPLTTPAPGPTGPIPLPVARVAPPAIAPQPDRVAAGSPMVARA
jgi:glycosyltransferase involved in cell wall biosynthesis